MNFLHPKAYKLTGQHYNLTTLPVILTNFALTRRSDVIKAAATKWNFLPFTPGLVGGHCIGVDPYYLTAKAEELGYHSDSHSV
ncbi:MAG: hypothetical protein AAED33_05170 [Paracoccaceae bacterium]